MVVAPDTTIVLAQGHIQKGEMSKFSEDEVFTLCDMLAEAFKLGALLQHSMTYELIDFLARLQVAVVARMAQEHIEHQVIERALDNEPTSNNELKLQKVAEKGQQRNVALVLRSLSSIWR